MTIINTHVELSDIDLMVVLNCLDRELEGLVETRTRIAEEFGHGVLLDATDRSIARMIRLIDHFDNQMGA